MAISFGGLTTGIDTSSLIARLETDKNWNSSRLAALGQFEGKLLGFLQKLEDIDSATEVLPRKATLSAEGLFKATAAAEAFPSSYQLRAAGFPMVATMSRPAAFDLWAVASTSLRGEDEMRALAAKHFVRPGRVAGG